MYDSDEEIRKKRKNLLIIIGVVVLVIILIIIFLVLKSGKKTTKKEEKHELSCELEVRGVTPNENNIYNKEVEVGFKTINATEPLQKQTVGVTDNSRNKDTYQIIKSGEYVLHGYLQDTSGNKATCEIKVVVNLSEPTCGLEVIKGTKGDNDWYTSEVEVGFGEMNPNSDTAGIERYYIAKSTDTNTSGQEIENYLITENGTTEVVGHIFDTNGNEGICKLEVKVDKELPTCTLKVVSGTPNSQGVYTDEPEIEIEESSENITEIVGKGVGKEENFTTERYKVTDEGTTTVYGYVKDSAGNVGTCTIEITRPTTKPEEKPDDNPPEEHNPPANNPTSLASVVKVGDYVAYDNSTQQGTKCYEKDTETRNGWRVLRVTNNKVVLIHAGMRDCVEHPFKGDAATTLNTINSKINVYINSFAEKGEMLSCQNLGIDCSGNYLTNIKKLLNIGDGDALTELLIIKGAYFLASNDGDSLWFISESGLLRLGSKQIHGIRPVITLKSTIKKVGGSGTSQDPYTISE